MILYRKYKIVTYVTMPLRKICYHYHEAWSVVDFSCVLIPMELSFISKTGMLFLCSVSTGTWLLMGIIFKWG